MKKATKTKHVNKSQAIRDYLAKNPDASPKEIRAALEEKGIKVSEGLISVVKYGERKRAGGKAAGIRKRGNSFLTGEDLIEAKKLVDQLGGIKQARKALDVLEKLS